MLTEMDPELLCTHCMEHLTNVGEVCPHCGYDNGREEDADGRLPVRTILAGGFLTGVALGQGGFGITYIGYDLHLDRKVAIKEYYPQSIVHRAGDGRTVAAARGRNEEAFEAGRTAFLNEARTLARFGGDPAIVFVIDYFNENNTAYIVMEYISGGTLQAYAAAQGGRLSAEETLRLMRPLFPALESIHRAGLLHRDISPDNIMLQGDGAAKLLDFGAARRMTTGDERGNTVNVKKGYAPPEQYQSNGRQGQWTDIYALCATIYRLTTGAALPEALDVAAGAAEVVPPRTLKAAFTPAQEEALLKGLSVQPSMRQQSVRELYAELYGEELDAPERAAGSARAQAEVRRESSSTAQKSTEEKRRALEAERERAEQRTAEMEQRAQERAAFAEEQAKNRAQKRELRAAWCKNHKKALLLAASAVFLLGIVLPITLFVIVPQTRYQRATALLVGGQYAEAAAAFDAMGDYRSAAEQARAARYANGCALLEAKRYDDAAAAFTEAEGYADSADMLSACQYQQAGELLTQERYDDAAAIYGALGEYKDSAELVTECAYLQACAWMQSGTNDRAAEAFEAMPAYKDSAELARGCRYAIADGLMKQNEWLSAAEAFADVGDDYKDCAEKRKKCIYNAAMDYFDDKKYEEAAALLLQIPAYEDSDEKYRAAIYAVASGYYYAGEYQDAAEQFAKISGYLDSDALAKECRYAYAGLLASAGEYLAAAEVYSSLGKHMASVKNAANCIYQAACALMDAAKYREAIELFRRGDPYNNASEKIQICMYNYACDHFSIADEDTVDYFMQLKRINYRDSVQKYHTLMNWQVDVYAAKQGSTSRGDMRFLVSDTVVFHVSLAGGIDGATVPLHYLYTLPNGKIHGGDWVGEQADGWNGAAEASYPNAVGETPGTLTIQIFNKATGEKLAELAVLMSD